MKKGFTLLMGLVAISLAFTSCKKDDDDEKSGALALGVIEGRVDGNMVSLDYLSPGGAEFNQSYEPSYGHLTTLSRYRSMYDFETWTIFFYGVKWDTVTVPYTYDVRHTHDAYEVEFSYTPAMMAFPMVSTDGTITVTKVTNSELEGTFSGTILNNEDTMTVTNGRFRMPYITVN